MFTHHGFRSLALGTALGLGLLASPALAFDQFTWTLTLTRTDTKTSTSNSTLTAFPTGDVNVEARQIKLGSVHAESTGTASVTPINPADAMGDPGAVEATAQAYGNVYSASSELAMAANVGQFHAGEINTGTLATPAVPDPAILNANHAYAEKMIADVSSGLISSHQTTATAMATNVTNASALAEARAVSNSVSLELAAAPAEPVTGDLGLADPSTGFVTNGLLAADTTRLSIGRVTGTATSGTDIAGYSNLGGISRPISAANATAIGNLGTVTARIGTLPSGI